MSGLLISSFEVTDSRDNDARAETGRTDTSVATLVDVCARQLSDAIEDSRLEMDSLTMAVVRGDGKNSAELLVRLQSIDRLMQRLDNVKANLGYVVRHLEMDDEVSDMDTLTAAMRASFTMPSERELFDATVGNGPDHAARSDDEVVLF